MVAIVASPWPLRPTPGGGTPGPIRNYDLLMDAKATASLQLPPEQRWIGGPAGITILALAGIAAHLTGRVAAWPHAHVPLLAVLILGGGIQIIGLLRNLATGRFGADFLAGLSVVTALALGEYLAGAIIVLMLAGGEALEERAVGKASAVLDALARRMPAYAWREGPAGLEKIEVAAIVPGDELAILPHEVCPVDGEVTEGRGRMDESFLTGEPWEVPKAPGSTVLSGALNGEERLRIRATRPAQDSRYAKIVQVVAAARDTRPALRRLGDRLGAIATPVALAVATVAWLVSGDPTRFLAVLVVATPCPLLIAIPVTIIGAVSVAARHGIILRDPVVLERLPQCRTLIFDKTGTLTAGRPVVTDVVALGPNRSLDELARSLSLVASAEQYSRHPLAEAIVEEAKRRGLALVAVDRVAERPGQGLVAEIGSTAVRVTGRAQLGPSVELPPGASGLECVVLIDHQPALLVRLRDRPRPESRSFLSHLGPKHQIERVLLVSGDREAEVRWFAETVGIQDVRAEQQPEDKVSIVREESARAPVCMVGDGLNDAPALLAAHVGIALGSDHEVTSEAAGAIVLEPSLIKVDVLFHLARRQRRIALQSALGGMALSLAGMILAALGLLPPVAGALAQEGIDLLAVLNAVRTALPVKDLSDVDLPSA